MSILMRTRCKHNLRAPRILSHDRIDRKRRRDVWGRSEAPCQAVWPRATVWRQTTPAFC
jgi:hypothetical protein